jgi:hypothetical protein
MADGLGNALTRTNAILKTVQEYVDRLWTGVRAFMKEVRTLSATGELTEIFASIRELSQYKDVTEHKIAA